jgi:hypothetical protein
LQVPLVAHLLFDFGALLRAQYADRTGGRLLAHRSGPPIFGAASLNMLILPGREAVQCADVSSTLTRTISGNGRERRAVRDQRRRRDAIPVRLPGRGR